MATTQRTIRISDDLWEAAKLYADDNGTTIADIIRAYLESVTND